jgi:hypothetical protein
MRSPTNNSDADPAGQVVAPIVRAPASSPAASTSADFAAQPSSRLESDVAFNPFGALNMGAPAALGQPKKAIEAPTRKRAKQAAPPPPPPPAPPVAPPLPFVAIGSISGADVTDGQPVVFLQQQDRLLVVRAGETVAGAWRLESITPQRIEFIYLPLAQRQSLPLAP